MRAILIVDHGSRRAEAHDSLRTLAIEVAGALPERCVRIAHLEIAEPSLDDALESFVRDGASEIAVYPFFLGPGKHSLEDIPGAIEAARSRHPEVEFRLEKALGSDPRIAELVVDSLR